MRDRGTCHGFNDTRGVTPRFYKAEETMPDTTILLTPIPVPCLAIFELGRSITNPESPNLVSTILEKGTPIRFLDYLAMSGDPRNVIFTYEEDHIFVDLVKRIPGNMEINASMIIESNGQTATILVLDPITPGPRIMEIEIHKPKGKTSIKYDHLNNNPLVHNMLNRVREIEKS